MKKTLRTMGLCALIALAAVACKKNEQKDTMTFKANLPQPACDAKTHIGTGNWLMWNAGDAIKVYTADKNEDNAATFTTTDADQTTANFSGTLAQSELYYAFYPTTGVELNTDGKFVLPVSATQTFVESNFTTNTYPMCATSTDGTFNFRSPYGILGIPMKGNATIGSIVLTDTTGMQLAGYYAMDATDTTFVGTGASITLDFGTTGVTLDATTPTTAYFIVPAGVFTNGFNAAVKGTDGSLIKNLGTLTGNTIVAEHIRLMPETTVNVNTFVPIFSIDFAKTVQFSSGNLYYDGSNWGFESTPQYAQYNVSPGYLNVFSWGANGNIAGGGVDIYENNNNCNAHNLGDADWGTVVGVQDGVTGWRTLTSDEWIYLLDLRDNQDNLYGFGKVGDINGLILLPDNWTLPTGCSFTAGIANGWNTNQYTAAEWNTMKSAGAVFLPAAGNRLVHNTLKEGSTEVLHQGDVGYYWSSSQPYGEPHNMMFIDLIEGGSLVRFVNSDSHSDGRYGYSVRLVHDAE